MKGWKEVTVRVGQLGQVAVVLLLSVVALPLEHMEQSCSILNQ